MFRQVNGVTSTSTSMIENTLYAVSFEPLNNIWKFLGVDTEISELKESIIEELSDNPDADWQREKQREVANLIRKGLPGSWRDIFTEEDRGIFKEIAGETLVEWGYEKDHNW